MANLNTAPRVQLIVTLILALVTPSVIGLLSLYPRDEGSAASPTQDAASSTHHVDSSHLPLPPLGHVSGTVHDVFGDPVPLAEVWFDDRLGRADESGAYHIAELPVGSYDVRVEARGYQLRTFRYTVYEGESSPRIKYESGLWPEVFAIDFHVFHPPNRSERLYGVIGLANPNTSPIFLTSMYVLDRDDHIVQDFLGDIDRVQSFVLTYGSTRLSLEPTPAILVPGRGTVTHIEMKPFTSTESDAPFTLVVTYAERDEYRTQKGRRAEKVVSPQVEEDYNPHSP